MKKLFLSVMLIAFVSGAAFAINDGGGKKKNKKKAKTECNMQNCDPKNCDLKKCEPKKCGNASAQTKCVPASCAGN